MSSDLLVTIEILDEDGKVVQQRLATTFRKLLDASHAAKLSSVSTEIVSATPDSVIVRATVVTANGTFTGIGDATPDNVAAHLRSSLARVAETRATARAMRFSLNVGYAAVEEIAETIRFVKPEQENDRTSPPPSQPRQPAPIPGDRRGFTPRTAEHRQESARGDAPQRVAMSDAQKKLVFRLVYAEGHEGDRARDRALEVLGVARLEYATRLDASRAIDALRRGAMNGHANGGARHHDQHGREHRP